MEMDNYILNKEVMDKYSLRGKVFNKIREDILAGNYPEKSELREAAISKKMGVSRTSGQYKKAFGTNGGFLFGENFDIDLARIIVVSFCIAACISQSAC